MKSFQFKVVETFPIPLLSKIKGRAKKNPQISSLFRVDNHPKLHHMKMENGWRVAKDLEDPRKVKSQW